MTSPVGFALFATFVILAASTIAFIDHARCEFDEVFRKAFNP